MTSTFSRTASIWGTITGANGTLVRVAGLGGVSALGDLLKIERPGLPDAFAEVVLIEGEIVTAMLLESSVALACGMRAVQLPASGAPPSPAWLGHVVDAFGVTGASALRPAALQGSPDLHRRPPPGRSRRAIGPQVETGFAALDTLLPICRGQRMGIFAGSGVGKSTLLTNLARGTAADITVIALIGERGREIGALAREFLRGSRRTQTVVIAASSDEAPLVKRRAGYLALATAEHFRDAGAHVLLLFDSITRFAEAHRDIALATGDVPALRAFPPSTGAVVSNLCERAGPGPANRSAGDITAVFTVLVSGSDMEEPIADLMRGILDGHVILDRKIAERGRFPAIDLVRSVSRTSAQVWSPDEAELCRQAREAVATCEEAAPLVRSGLYVPGNDPELDRALSVRDELDEFLGGFAIGTPRTQVFARLKAIMDRRET